MATGVFSYSGTTILRKVIDGSTSGDNTIIAAVADKRICVVSLYLVTAGAVDIRFEDGAGGTQLTGLQSLAAKGSITLNYNPSGWFLLSTNTLLNMELGGNIQCSGALTYLLVT